MFFGRQQRELVQRQQQLQARSALLRLSLGQDAQALQYPLGLADQVREGWRWLKANPHWLVVAVAVLVVWRPRRMWRFGGRLWVGWRLWQRVQRWRSTLGPLLTLLPLQRR